MYENSEQYEDLREINALARENYQLRQQLSALTSLIRKLYQEVDLISEGQLSELNDHIGRVSNKLEGCGSKTEEIKDFLRSFGLNAQTDEDE